MAARTMVQGILGGLVLLTASCSQAEATRLRIVTYNVAGLNSLNAGNPNCDPDALPAVFVALAADNTPGFAVAPHLFVFQEVESGDQDDLLAMLRVRAPRREQREQIGDRDSAVSVEVGRVSSVREATANRAELWAQRTHVLACSEPAFLIAPEGVNRVHNGLGSCSLENETAPIPCRPNTRSKSHAASR